MLDKLTIIIPCLEEVHLLDRCLLSIENKLPDQKVVVIQMADWEIDPFLGKKLNIKNICTHKRGAAAARNFGAQSVDSDYIWFLDSDNWLPENDLDWQVEIEKAIAQKPELIVLQRAEEDRKISFGVKPNRWNFSRHCIEWNLIWSREHFLSLGGLNEKCCPGSDTMAQCGEAFSICFKHFTSSLHKTIYLPQLHVKHPSLSKPETSNRRILEYAYGSSYSVSSQIRQQPSLMSTLWFARNLVGFVFDLKRGLTAKNYKKLIQGRFLGIVDGLLCNSPRPREYHQAQEFK